MKKKLLCLIAISIFLIQTCSSVFASADGVSNNVKIAIKKYKKGNFTGCLQDCQAIVNINPSNTLAYYYMAMSYVQAGKKNEAIKSYSKVLKLKPNTILSEYASTGKRCLETPDKCILEPTTKNELTEIDKFIASPSADGLSPAVRRDFEQKSLDGVKNEINKDKELDDYNFKKFRDFSGQNTPTEDQDKIALNKPTNEEVKAALKVLSDAGVNPYTNTQISDVASPSAQPQDNNTQAENLQNSELMQINALMGNNNQSNNNNSMLNMLPYMLAQDKNGKSNYSPQMMQAVIMSSMMTDLNYNVDKDK